MKRRIPIIVVAIAIIALLVWLFVIRPNGADSALVASGTVEATEARLGFQAAGRIESILVDEGDAADSGNVLAQLDRTEALARRDQAEAQVAAARALLAELESGFRPEEVAQARAARRAADEQLRDAERDLDRTKTLFEGGAVSQEIFDKARTRYDIAESQSAQAMEQYRLVESGPRTERIAAQRAQLANAEAALRNIDAVLNNMTVRSSFDGIVTVRHREPGEIVSPGAPVLTVMNRGNRWIRIYVPEYHLGGLQLGQLVSISSDTYPDRTYKGEVTYIASEAEFTPKTVQTTEERVKLVYAVKVRILEDANFELKPGMPADVTFELPAS